MAPEMWRSANFDDAKSDVWSFGCILFKMISFDFPFKG